MNKQAAVVVSCLKKTLEHEEDNFTCRICDDGDDIVQFCDDSIGPSSGCSDAGDESDDGAHSSECAPFHCRSCREYFAGCGLLSCCLRRCGHNTIEYDALRSGPFDASQDFCDQTL